MSEPTTSKVLVGRAHCTSCGHGAEPDHRFCAKCGKSLK